MAAPIITTGSGSVPTSSSIASGAYTVPSGKAAKITYVPSSIDLGTGFGVSGSTTLTEAQIGLQVNGTTVWFYGFRMGGSGTNSTSNSRNIYLPARAYGNWSFSASVSTSATVNASSVLGYSNGLVVIAASGTGGAYLSTSSAVIDGFNLSVNNLTGYNLNNTGTWRLSADMGANGFQNTSFWLKAGDVIACPAGGYYMLDLYDANS